MKTVYVKPNTYIDSNKEIHDKDPKFKIGDIVRISDYKNIFAKCYVPNWSEEVFFIKKVKKYRSVDILAILKAKKFLEHFTKTNCKKQIKKSLEPEKVIKRKGDKLYVKWKGYDNSFKSRIDKKDIIFRR